MNVSEKAKERLDGASKEIKESLDNLRKEAGELRDKVKDRMKGSGEDMRESAEDIYREVKGLSEKVRELIPARRRKRDRSAMRQDDSFDLPFDSWERPFVELRKATNRLFDDFMRSFGGPPADRRGRRRGMATDVSDTGWPHVDMSENEDEIKVTAELPGVDKDHIDITVSDDRLTIRGEKEEKEERKKRDYYQSERFYGSFQRNLYLTCEVEADKADASFRDGILTVKLPKSAAAREQARKITIREG